MSQEERARIKTAKKKQMFNHNLIFKTDLAYNHKVQMWWLVYIEGVPILSDLQEVWFQESPKQEGSFCSWTKYKVEEGMSRRTHCNKEAQRRHNCHSNEQVVCFSERAWPQCRSLSWRVWKGFLLPLLIGKGRDSKCKGKKSVAVGWEAGSWHEWF